LLTGIGGEVWKKAAAQVGAEFGMDINVHVIGPRQEYVDHVGDWARTSEVSDTGCILVRPDHHVAWRGDELSEDPIADLTRVMTAILAR
jgi:2,4-dichlorophenol 6-monooxygenase